MSIKPEEFAAQAVKLCAAKRRPLEGPFAGGDQGAEADIEEAGLSEEEPEADRGELAASAMTPTPDPVPMSTNAEIDQIDGGPRQALANDSPKRRRTDIDEAALFNTSNRKSKNCATFYFKHMDTDSEADGGAESRCHQQEQQNEESSEEEWTYTSARLDDQQQQQQQQPGVNGGNDNNNTSKSVKVRLNFDEEATPPAQLATGTDEATDSDMANGNVLQGNEKSPLPKENNSDDECTNDKDRIQRLIREVEKLVREEGRGSQRIPSLIFDDEKGLLSPQNHRAKYARIKEWLALNSARCREGRCTSQYCLLSSEALDSCDASGEYTTGESDVEKQLETSEEEAPSSAATCRLASQSNSEEILEERRPAGQLESSTPKVVMRTKRRSSAAPRPWSVSCITQISKRASLGADASEQISQFSISETALHQLVAFPPAKSASLDASESRAPFNNSTSTLLEETIISHDARVVRNSSLRRRKNRLRKKNVGRKSESGSDGVACSNQGSDEVSSSGNANPSLRSARKSSTLGRQTRGGRQCAPAALVKSGSFSGYSARQEGPTERTTASDTSKPARCRSAGSSESDDEEEESAGAGGLAAASAAAAAAARSVRGQRACIGCGDDVKHADSDLEKNSLSNNSFSEQAWDNYQEKYMSEPYSEVADIETARRLLEFGDDYRNFLDSQSDCASSLSAVHYKSNVTTEDSDSDSEFKRLAETSRNQLLLSEARYGTMTNTSFVRIALENFFSLINYLRGLLSKFKKWLCELLKNYYQRFSQGFSRFRNKVVNSFKSLFSFLWCA